jgi:mono/diheme cytochrome c family protein
LRELSRRGLGRLYLASVIRVEGEPFGLEAVMKPFGELLSAGQIADLVAYLRSTPSIPAL